jgi:DNA mismatch repair protein MutS
MKIYDEYFSLLSFYQKKYGEKSFLLYQVGSFFEVYGMEGELENIQNYANITSLAIAAKKVCVGKKQIYMCGYRDYMLDKYIQKIHPYGYVCVVYVQHDEGGKIKRRLHEIYSPATTFVEESSSLSNNISCLWIQKSKGITGEKFVFGISNIDIYTGKSNMCEYYENYFHNPTTYDSVEKFISIYNPIELVIIHNVGDEMINSIIQYLNCKSKRIHRIDIDDQTNDLSIQAKKCESQIYQNEIIDKFYPYIQNKEIFKYNVYEKTISFQSFCFLINFVEQQNASLIHRVKEPIIENQDENLICANHSLKQLNVIDNSESSGIYSSVSKLLNKCKTKIGKRYMNDILLNPICDINKLQNRYDAIEYYLEKNYDVSSLLTNIKDIEKMITKIKISKSTPYDYAVLYQTIDSVMQLSNYYQDDKILYNKINVDKSDLHDAIISAQNILDKYFNIGICEHIPNMSFEKFPEYNHNMLKKGNFKTLDKEACIKVDYRIKLNLIIECLNTLFTDEQLKSGKKIKSGTEFIKIHQPASSEMIILMTKKRKTFLQSIINNSKESNILKLSGKSEYTGKELAFDFDISKLSFKDYNKTDCSIHSELINDLIRSLFSCNLKFNDILMSSFKSIYSIIIDSQYDNLCNIVEFVKQTDVLNNQAHISKQYNYSKPKITKSETSFINIKGLRHPLIEHIDTNEIYVSNDVYLGEKETNLGLLLFGTNAVGKTSFIKSIGISVIMAQSGFYVPCQEMEYMPYKYIFTRIIGNDNLFKGLSTFGVEMSELRVILNNCNKNSLILGDELCSGTEIDSALAIFLSSLEIMSCNKSTFVFATHFHQIKDFDEIQNMNSVSLKHMKVVYNNETQCLVYNRKLCDGAGESIYGLEVCKSLNMPCDFIKRCYDIRNKHIDNTNNVLTLKPCRYNKEKVKGMCEICKQQKGVEIHHLQYQKDANENNYISNGFHKDHKANLISICEKCHDFIHKHNLRYERRKTSNGYENIVVS